MECEVQYESREHLTSFDERTIKLLGAYGLYDASLDIYDTVEREDSRWAVELDSNPNIVPSNN